MLSDKITGVRIQEKSYNVIGNVFLAHVLC